MSAHTFSTKSKRTTISVEIDEVTGIAQVLIDRDGHRIQQIDVSKEPVEKVGT